jgi:hypothetical protein
VRSDLFPSSKEKAGGKAGLFFATSLLYVNVS